MSDVEVHMTPAPVFFTEVFRLGGEVDRGIKRRAEFVEDIAITLCPTDSGRLASTIHVEQNRRENGWFGFGYRISAGGPVAPYVNYVVADTSPHVIRGNPKLNFFWEKVGQQVSFFKVNHPGTKGQPFLDEALQLAGRGL